MSRYILGVHSGHDASAVLIKDNTILYGIEKERLSRKKHDFGEPIECIEYVLQAANLTHEDIDLVVRCNWYDADYLMDDYYHKFKKVISNANHHLFHAYAVSLMCPEDMLIYIVDGRGCRQEDTTDFTNHRANPLLFEAESLYSCENFKITPIEKRFSPYEKNKFPWGSHFESIGYAYAHVSRLIFGTENAAGKIMALAAYGHKNQDIPPPFHHGDHDWAMNPKWLHFLETLPYPLSYTSDMAKDLCYQIQKALEEFYQHKGKCFQEKYHYKNLGLGGGVALNCKNNGLFANEGYFDAIHIFPASGDNGLAVGAALWALREIYDNFETVEWNFSLGKSYGEREYHPKTIENFVKRLKNGEVLALFEGGSEYGPRALCHRSIISSVDDISRKDYINREIKQRESFRPFGGVLLERNLHRLTNDRMASDFMLSAVHVKEEYLSKIPAVLHKDGTSRLQVIRDTHSTIYHVLDLYEKEYGEFLLLNTSFNGKNQPIVETPEEGKLCAKSLNLDGLYLNGKEIF